MGQYTDIEYELNGCWCQWRSWPEIQFFWRWRNQCWWVHRKGWGTHDLQLINDNLSIISETPGLHFVSDSDISKVTTWQGIPHVKEVENKCHKCRKNYMRRLFFDKHVAQCEGNKRKRVEGM